MTDTPTKTPAKHVDIGSKRYLRLGGGAWMATERTRSRRRSIWARIARTVAAFRKGSSRG